MCKRQLLIEFIQNSMIILGDDSKSDHLIHNKYCILCDFMICYSKTTKQKEPLRGVQVEGHGEDSDLIWHSYKA